MMSTTLLLLTAFSLWYADGAELKPSVLSSSQRSESLAPALPFEETNKRTKRQIETDTNDTKPPRVRTTDTILNIRGSVRSVIGDGSPRPAPPPAASSRLDAFVIRPAAASMRPALLHDSPGNVQPPRDNSTMVVEPLSTVRLKCPLTNATNVRWYKDGEVISLPRATKGAPMWRELISGYSIAVVAKAGRHDTGEWACERDATRALVARLMIYEAVSSVYLLVDGRRLDPGNTWLPAKEHLRLPVECRAEGGVPPPNLVWKLIAKDPGVDTSTRLQSGTTNHTKDGAAKSEATVVVSRELHLATLSCIAEQVDAPETKNSSLIASLELRVTYPPSFALSRWPGFGVAVVSGQPAALRCDVDANPPAAPRWNKDQTALLEGIESEEGAAWLRWSSIPLDAGGWYRCRTRWMEQEYSSVGYFLNVLPAGSAPPPPPPPPATEYQKVEVSLGGNVQLHCPNGSVGCWWRRDNTTWSPTGAKSAHGVLGIKDAIYADGGEYRCIGASHTDTLRLQELKRVTLTVSGAATATAISWGRIMDGVGSLGGWRLQCSVCGRGVSASWMRPSRVTALPAPLTPSIRPHCYTTQIHVTDPDEMWCVAANSLGGSVAVFPSRVVPATHLLRSVSSGAQHVISALLPILIAGLLF